MLGPGFELYFKPPGLGSERSGIITDPNLEKIAGLSLAKQRLIAADLFGNRTLKNIILKNHNKKIRFSFLYGAHNEVFKGELIGQTKMFMEALERNYTESPIIVFTPNSQDDLRKVFPEITHMYSLNDLFEDMHFDNQSYIISIPKMTSFQFLSLMAIADLPILIEGNS